MSGAGSSPRVALPSRAGDFLPGRSALFRLELPHLGPLERLRVACEGAGAGPAGWHLDSVRVEDESTGEDQCPCFCADETEHD